MDIGYFAFFTKTKDLVGDKITPMKGDFNL